MIKALMIKAPKIKLRPGANPEASSIPRCSLQDELYRSAGADMLRICQEVVAGHRSGA
jgi:hypothetical protein